MDPRLFLYLVIILSATFHEYAHGWMAYRLGDTTAKDAGRLTLNPLAHELSHVANRDMLVSTAAVVLAGFISILADMFMRSLFFRGMFSRRDDRGGGGALFLLGIILSILAPLGALLMRLAISRRRESLADISGAGLTKKPEHLASALEKINLVQIPMRAANNTTAHLWIENPFKGRERVSLLHKLFLSHPPVEERTRALRSLKF